MVSVRSEMNSCGTDRSRPWNYVPRGVIRPICVSTLYQSLTTQQSLVENQQATRDRIAQSTAVGSTVAATLAQSTAIQSTVAGQVLASTTTQQAVYQRQAPVCVPSSVIQLQQLSQNVGVSIKPFTFADCKGNQYVSSQP